MKILKLEWKNIFSYGDDVTTIDFGEDAKLWQLSGRSGSGKSSLLTIPKLLLFGKTEGSDGRNVSVTAIANRINKKGWIRGTIKKGKDLYIIERTFSPSGLTLFKNGEQIDKAGIKSIQDIIEDDVLDGMPYHIFANVMTLSLNNFKSFISMTPADKRAIIDKIFSLEIINKVYELVKKDMRDLGNEINSSNSQMFTLDQMIKTSTAELESLSSGQPGSQDKLAELQTKLATVSDLYQKHTKLYSDHYAKYNELVLSENQLKQLIYQKNVELNTIQQKINLFNQDKCPTCGTSFNSEAFADLKQALEKQKNDVLVYIDDLTKKVETINESKKSYESLLTELNNNITKINTKYQELLVEYRTIEAVIKSSSEANSIRNIIKTTEESKANLEKSLKDSNDKMEILSVMEELYSADGIKQDLMNNYIPTLNEEVAETLKALGFPYTLEFDAMFDAHLQDVTGEITPQSLSTGEHKKVDLTVLCAILKMLKRKYPQINLVCLDETVSSLDYESSTDVIKYLKELSKSMGMNIFIVSHTTLDENLFDVHLSVEKPYGYSVLSVI